MSVVETRRKLSLFRILLIAVAVVVIGWIAMRLTFPDRPTIFAGIPPENLGLQSGQLAPCPSTPNCVSSQSQEAEHAIAPLTYTGIPENALGTLDRILENFEGATIVAREDRYRYAEFTSQWMGFVDDVEFVLNEEAGEIDVRSASRLGESDLGVNRQRIEAIREQLRSAT